jgi:hypothetical protein
MDDYKEAVSDQQSAISRQEHRAYDLAQVSTACGSGRLFFFNA